MSIDYNMLIKHLCTQYIGCCREIWGNSAHSLSTNNGSIIANFPYDFDINFILKNSFILKDTKFILHTDFS